MQVITSKRQSQTLVRDWQKQGFTVGFVPTMGHLHNGHLSLLKEARNHSDKVIVSIYVNPTQFSADEDFDTYPRTTEQDIDSLTTSEYCDAVYLPDEMYAAGHATMVMPDGVASGFEADSRPHFFTGVATIVLKLFQHVPADITVFGQKDFQQLQVIRQMVSDLDLDIQVLDSPTIRAEDGLALSSRNSYLTPEEREVAPLLFQTLTGVRTAITAGMPVSQQLQQAQDQLISGGFSDIDYLAFCDRQTLSPLGMYQPDSILLVAAQLGSVRLIDNLPVE